MLLNFNENELIEKNAFNTLNEIIQQPKVFNEIFNLILENKKNIELFLKEAKVKESKIIFSGAGTSEFIGNSIVHHFIRNGYDAQSISTTNLVQGIEDYINDKKDLILISFARSGDSPESVATFDKISNLKTNVKHIVITCNKEGSLAKKAIKNKNCLLFLLPEKANDKSFAMTSSFSAMMLSAILILDFDNIENVKAKINLLSQQVEKNIYNYYENINIISKTDFEKIVYLGSGDLNGIAEESQLKMLELTSGKINTYFNTPLGFRHGPKSLLNQKTLVIIYMNKNNYKRMYDIDLLKEIWEQKNFCQTIVIDYKFDENLKKYCTNYIPFYDDNIDVLTGINYVLFGQLLGFFKSLNIGISPDNPCPKGDVNRVVKGVKIY